jgi:PAS domain S-box-containing protein
MIARIQLPDGAFIDARNVPVALIGLLEGWPAGVLASLPPVIYRIWLGGPGAVGGVVGLVAAGLLGGLVHVSVRRAGRLGHRHALGLSLAVFLATFLTFVMVGSYALQLFERVWLPLLLTHLIGIGFTARLMRDVVEQAELRAERERFRAIVDEASDAIRIVDADQLTIVEVNHKDLALSGYTRDELIGRDVRQFWPREPELRSAWEMAAATAQTDGFSRGYGLSYRTRAGQAVSVDSTQRLVTHGGHRYIIVILREAAEREAAEAARREAAELRAVNLLAGAAAHEINNPLAVIMGAFDLLERQLPPDTQESQLVARGRGGVNRVHDIVERMARITRIESAPAGAHLPAILDIRKSSDPKETP